MKAAFLIMIALAVIGFFGCLSDTRDYQNREVRASSGAASGILDATTKSTSFQAQVFSHIFQELFLSDDPLQYDKSHSLLSRVDDLERNGGLSTQDKNLVTARLKQFLALPAPRQIDPEGGMSGVAPPEGVLRAYAVRLLGKLGDQSDISFLEEVRDSYQAEHPEGFSHPCFIDNCNEAIGLIKKGNR